METNTQIVPDGYPELRNLCWNRDTAKPIEREVAFAIYLRYWRFVYEEFLTDTETNLIRSLEIEFNHGIALGHVPERDHFGRSRSMTP